MCGHGPAAPSPSGFLLSGNQIQISECYGDLKLPKSALKGFLDSQREGISVQHVSNH